MRIRPQDDYGEAGALLPARITPAEPARLGWGRMLAYGLPACALAGPNFLIQSYFMNFATDVLLLAPVAVGILLAGARVWDAFSDPLVGSLSDRTRTRLGRRRPWMLAAAPFICIAFGAMWNPPAAWGPGALTAWAALALLGFTTAATAWNIPHAALAASLGEDDLTRTKLFGIRYMCMIAGVAASFGAMQVIVNSVDPRAVAGHLGLAIAAAMCALLVIPPLSLREAPTPPEQSAAASPWESMAAVLRNAQARRLLVVGFAEHMAMGAQGAVAPYMAIYVLERPDLIGVVPAFFIAPMVLSVPVWIALSKSVAKERLWTAAQCGGCLAYATLFTLDAGEIGRAALLLTFAGIFSGCGGPIGPATLTDVIERDARASGVRREGVFFAAWLFVDKASGACVVLLVGVALQLSGFEPNAPLSAASNFAIRACLGIAPALMFAVGALALRRYSRALASD